MSVEAELDLEAERRGRLVLLRAVGEDLASVLRAVVVLRVRLGEELVEGQVRADGLVAGRRRQLLLKDFEQLFVLLQNG